MSEQKIIVFNNFEIDNGMLGLERDVYLSVVKFFDSSTVRKVRVDIFCFV
jgi:hypothetical protein